jgi:ComEC/Rec2-related protein
MLFFSCLQRYFKNTIFEKILIFEQMDRGVFSFSIFFLLGIYTNNVLSYNYLPLLICSSIFIIILFLLKKHTIKFIILSHITIFILGASSINLCKSNKTLLPDKISPTQTLRDTLSHKLLKIVPSQNEHSTLCALTLGDKTNMPYKLKKSYINAGAIHVLALSGLHIGIVYAIISSLLSFLDINYKGYWLKFIISIMMIFFYSYLTGLSPSVLRASCMILVYKLCVLLKRDKEKWNVLALVALIIAAISPTNATNIGFQLSFSAVIGIIALYPSCEMAYENIFKKIKIFSF